MQTSSYPVDAALAATAALASAGVVQDMALHLDVITRRRTPDGVFTAYGPAVDEPETWLGARPSGVTLTRAFALAAGSERMRPGEGRTALFAGGTRLKPKGAGIDHGGVGLTGLNPHAPGAGVAIGFLVGDERMSRAEGVVLGIEAVQQFGFDFRCFSAGLRKRGGSGGHGRERYVLWGAMAY